MSPDFSTYSMAEVVRTLKRIEEGQKAIQERLNNLTSDYVTRAEWNTKNQAYDREIKELKGSRAPWWSVAAVLTGAGSLLITLIVVITG